MDPNGQSLAYVYGHADERDAQVAKSLPLDEAERIASNIAKLPTLLVRAAREERYPGGGQMKRLLGVACLTALILAAIQQVHSSQ